MNSECLNYSDLQDLLFEKAVAVGQPLNGMFELTNRCNLSCQMCYIVEPEKNKLSKSKEISTSDWVELSKQATQAGMLFVCLTGGEPFMRKDFFEIYEPLTKLGLNITLFTNATLITPEIANRLAIAPPSRLEVSLYGATKEVHERITGVSGSYRRCLKGIDELQKAGNIPILIKTALSRLNVQEVAGMKKLANDRGLPFQSAWLLKKHRYKISDGAEKIRLSPEELVKLEIGNEILPQVEKGKNIEDPKSAFRCHAGQASFTINSYGEMGACTDLQIPNARVLEIGFDAAWEETRKAIKSVDPSPVCSVCDDKHLCPHCPAYAFLESGFLEAPIPYFCDIAHKRRRALDKNRK